jgi:glycerate kinase
VVTGEGKFDEQSFRGKTVGAVLDAARRRDLPAAVVAGRADVPAPAGVPVLSLVDVGGTRRAFEDAPAVLEEAAARLAARDDWLRR